MFDSTLTNHSIDHDWVGFRDGLANHLAAMEIDDILIFEWHEAQVSFGSPPWIQFLRWSNRDIRAEVVSNAYLAPSYRVAPHNEELLCGFGWNRPTRQPEDPGDSGSPAFYVDRKMRKTRRLAALTVTTLRDFWGVPHPRMLRAKIIGSLEGTNLMEVDHANFNIRSDNHSESASNDAHRILEQVIRVSEEALGITPQISEEDQLVLTLGEKQITVVFGSDGPALRMTNPVPRSGISRISDGPVREFVDLPAIPFDSRQFIRILSQPATE